MSKDMKKTTLTIMLTALAWCSATAQEASSAKSDDGKKKTVTVKPYGFVRNYFNLDTARPTPSWVASTT